MQRTKTLEQRLNECEERLNNLEEANGKAAPRANGTLEGWQKLSVAASKFKVHPDTLRNKIQQARAFPGHSPFKINIHWRMIGGNYQIHLENWTFAESIGKTAR